MAQETGRRGGTARGRRVRCYREAHRIADGYTPGIS
jgi:hypothetical protein